MSKEKLQYNNIRAVQIRGKTKYRFEYRGADNKTKFITRVKKKDLTPIVVKKVETDGYQITDFNYWSIDDAYKLWYDRQEKKQLAYNKPSKSCIKDYDSFATHHILPYFYNQDARLIDKKLVKSFVIFLEQKKTINARTLSKVFNVLSAILDESAAKEKIARNVCKDLNYLSDIVIVENQQPRLDFEEWSLDRVQQLINHVDRDDMKLMFHIMLQTACRPSEIRGLTKSNLKFAPA